MHVDIHENERKLAMRRGNFEAAWQVTDRLEARRKRSTDKRQSPLERR